MADGVTVEYKPSDLPAAEDGRVEMRTPDKNHQKSSSLVPDGRSHPTRRLSRIPVLFERSAKSWWNPRFDSSILEDHHQKLAFRQLKRKFQYALAYIITSCIVWCIFFSVASSVETKDWLQFLIATVALLCIAFLVLLFSCTKFYGKQMLPTSIILSVLLCVYSLLNFAYRDSQMSVVGRFMVCIEILLMIYTVIPLRLYLCVVIGVLYSVTYELLSAYMTHMSMPQYIVGRALLHFCIHLIGIHIFLMSQVRKRSTFLKVGQSIVSRRALEIEKQLKQRMIYSLMPPSVAAEVMKAREDNKEQDDNDEESKMKGHHHHDKTVEAGQMTFRSFHMSQMDSVSILFADIVGFTKMSSNKTAEHLVSLLNDLFGRFDVLCEKSGCEKISTLGDCYYCVSGCPTSRPDHAECCVEMGLAMVTAIQEFDHDHNEEVNMRVGVHTGTVLCGLVGTRRFKFDVWSHDVTIANTMESDGKPGLVHISDSCYKCVKHLYEVQPGDPVEDIRKHKVLIESYDSTTQQYVIRHVQDEDTIKTWFIECRKGSADGAGGMSPAEKKKETGSPETVAKDNVKVTLEEEEKETLQPNSTADTAEDSQVSDRVNTNHMDSQTCDVVTHSSLGVCDSPETSRSERDQDACCSCETDPITNPSCSCRACAVADDPISHANGYVCNISTSRDNVAVEGAGSEEPLHDVTGYVMNDWDDDLQPDSNGMTSAALLNKRDNVAASMEELGDSSGDTALMEQISARRQQKEQTDKELIKCMEEDTDSEEYLYRPPINRYTLNFLHSDLESQYRNHYVEDDKMEERATFSLPRFSSLFDIVVSLLFMTSIAICCFLGFPHSPAWITVCILAFIIEIVMLLPLLIDVCVYSYVVKSIERLGNFLSSWYPRHIFGAVTASLPAVAIYSNFACDVFEKREHSDIFYCLCLVASLLHYCNFTMLSSWMKSTLATVTGVVLVVLITVGVCMQSSPVGLSGVVNATTPAPMSYLTNTQQANGIHTLETYENVSRGQTLVFNGKHSMKYEILINMALLLLLIWFLNREFEISYRVSFHGDIQAAKNRRQVQLEKDQADWLLHNIIPQHVAEVLKKDNKYCKNHKDVGVVFAKVVNFDDFYDESFEGGREYLRVLNELIGDFEDLFDDPKFKDVEKIKTIGSCLMAASGLNPGTRNQNKDPNTHLYAFVEFAQELLLKLEQFNAEIFNFDFKMSIGFNYGEVTAGVIGTTKPSFDIWGDTVNIASRMYSTGMPGRIQVTEDTSKKLEEKFEFEYRGKIYVKGKGDMNTYLLGEKKEGATWD